MRCWIRTPYSIEKNLGAEYNREMSMIPEGDSAVFLDGDCQFLTPDYGWILHEYAKRYPNNVLTCWITRIHQLATGQLYTGLEDPANLRLCIEAAEAQKKLLYQTTRITGSVSGTLLLIPKHIWNEHKFNEHKVHKQPGESNCLGVDNFFTNKVRAAGINVLRMDGLLLFHTYRLLNGVTDKSHLL